MSQNTVTRIDAAHDGLGDALVELARHRELMYFFVWRDVKVRYQQTLLGVAWAGLQPLGTMLIFTIVFGRLANLPSDGVPYPVFVLAGLLPWQVFSMSLSGAANSLVGSAALISKVYFPRLAVPVASALSTLADFAVSLVLLLVLMAYYRIMPGPMVFLLPVFVLLALATALAAGLWSSALHVRYRDVKYIVPFVVQVWLFASPVAYSMSIVKNPIARLALELNPMTAVIQGFRWALIGSPAPGGTVWVSIALALTGLASGAAFFKRMETTFADVI